jgi:hypothetical protein
MDSNTTSAAAVAAPDPVATGPGTRHAPLPRTDLALLADAGESLAASLDYESTLQAVADLAVPRLGDWCFVDVIDDEGGFRRLGVAHSDPGKAELAARFRRS